MDIDELKAKVREQLDIAEFQVNQEDRDRQLVLEELISCVRGLVGTVQSHVTVQLYRPGGKYSTEEQWRIPAGAIGPYDMINSPDFRRISNGSVVVPAQEPWSYPHLFPGIVQPS
jgi:hypothetical protein